MDGLAYRLLTAGEFEFAVISIVAVVMAAGFTLIFYRPAWTVSRSAYFATLCVCVAAGELSYLLQYLFLDALKQQQLGRLAFAYVLIWLTIGAVTGVISAARSRDAFGTMVWWPLAFVPFANLALIFYPSRQIRPVGRGRRLSHIVLVVCGLVLVGLTRAIPGPDEDYLASVSDRVQTDTGLRDNAMAYASDSKGLEATLKDMVAGVPLLNTELARMLSIEVHGDVVVTTQEVKDSTFEFDETWRDQTSGRLCLSKKQAMFMKMGATMKNVYQSSNGEKRSELIINTDTCNAWRAKKEKEIIADIEAMELPQEIGDMGAIVGASYKDKTVSYHYTLNVVPPMDTWEAAVKERMCNEDNFKLMVQLGMTIRARFDEVKADGNVPLTEIVMDATSCPADPL